MRALTLNEFGSEPAVREIDLPQPAAGEVRVRVRAASVNGFDIAVAAGYLDGRVEHRFPVVLGKDFAGIIDAVADDVVDFAPGDRVFGIVTKPYVGDGSFGEYVTVLAAVGLAKLPDSIGFAEGGSLGLAGSAGLGAVTAAKLQSGQTVFVAGATGGVGNQVVQLAALAGARVIASAHSAAEAHLVRSLGASDVVDYAEDVATQLRATYPTGVDAVVHLVGDPTALVPLVRRGGRFVSTIIAPGQRLPAEGVTVVRIFANPAQATLDVLAANQAQGLTRVTIQGTYSLDDAPQALRDFAAGALGKLVIVND
jgi:NADPH:quinone reductase-like Zn-dependent oxidoreductase